MTNSLLRLCLPWMLAVSATSGALAQTADDPDFDYSDLEADAPIEPEVPVEFLTFRLRATTPDPGLR